jgi:hypothetical protein
VTVQKDCLQGARYFIGILVCVCLIKCKGQERISGVGCSSRINFLDVMCEVRTDNVQEPLVFCLCVITVVCLLVDVVAPNRQKKSVFIFIAQF